MEKALANRRGPPRQPPLVAAVLDLFGHPILLDDDSVAARMVLLHDDGLGLSHGERHAHSCEDAEDDSNFFMISLQVTRG